MEDRTYMLSAVSNITSNSVPQLANLEVEMLFFLQFDTIVDQVMYEHVLENITKIEASEPSIGTTNEKSSGLLDSKFLDKGSLEKRSRSLSFDMSFRFDENRPATG
jgi:hypothetical protein